MRALKGLLRFDFQLTRLRQYYKKKNNIQSNQGHN